MICDGVLSFLPPPIWNAENEQGWQLFPLRLGRGDLDRLVLGLDFAELVADEQLQDDHRQQHDHRDPRGEGEGLDLVSLADLPGRDREHHERARHERGEDHVDVAPEERRVREQRRDVVQFGLAVAVHDVADGMLHPRVGGEDEQRREHRTGRHQPDAREVDALGETIPTENPQPEERRLEEERGQTLHRQRGAEHIADEA